MMWSIAVAFVAAGLAWALARGGPAARSESLVPSAQKIAPASPSRGERVVTTSAPAPGGKPELAQVKFPGTLELVSTVPGNTAGNASRRPASSPLAPGVYKTEPFACIVVVPGSQLDDAMIIPPPAGEFSMRTIVPDLRFIPINPTGK